MKLSFIIFLVLLVSGQLLLAYSSKGQALEKINIKIELRNATLKSAVKQIEKQTNLRFAYRDNVLSPNTKVNFSTESRSVKEVLDELFTSRGIGYNQIDNNIILYNNAVASTSGFSAMTSEKALILTVNGKVSDYTATQKANREAELRYLRAFYYWHIVETWGDVNFTTAPTVGALTEANRTPVSAFYDQIFADLQFAVANLPATTTDYGRATIPVAKAFLARMYLTRGMNAQAFAMADDVIKNYGYALQPKYVDLWNMGNLKNKEVIWAIDYSTNLTNNDLTTSTYPNGHGGVDFVNTDQNYGKTRIGTLYE